MLYYCYYNDVLVIVTNNYKIKNNTHTMYKEQKDKKGKTKHLS